MKRGLSGDLDDAFSLLPREKARQAKADVLRAHRRGGSFTLDLKWSDHETNGAFLRGGQTDLVSRTTSLFVHSQDDPDVQSLAIAASGLTVLEGQLLLWPSKDRFAWFLPHTPARADTQPVRRVRGLLITEPIFNHVIGLMQPEQGFTDAERRVLFQITAGLSPREAAEQDEVSFETKRAHIKSVASKLHCAGQKEIVRLVLGQLVHLLSASLSESVHGEPAEAYMAEHLGEDARLEVRRLPNGRILRIVECGPRSGRPLVMIHGMMFPISLVGIAEHLESLGIRLIIPIRTGFLESRSPAELAAKSNFIEESLEDLALFLESETDGPIPILGQSLGGVLAIRFANLYPHLVSRLVLQSVNFTQANRDGVAGIFYDSLKRLSRQPDLLKLVNWQFHKYYADRPTGRAMLSRLFDGSPVDMRVLDGKFSGTEAYRMFADLYAGSVFGMNGDFDFVMNSWQHEAGKLDRPIVFIHGGKDPLTNPALLEEFTGNGSRARLQLIPDGGHFVAASHPAQLWSLVAAELGIPAA